MKLRDLLEVFDNNNKDFTEDVDIFHWDIDEEYPTTVDLSLSNFTAEGLEQFADVLDSEVVRIDGRGKGWLAVFVKGVSSNKINEFCSAHAGYCSVEDYNLWFTMDREDDK